MSPVSKTTPMNRLKSTLTILAAATLVSATPMLAQAPHARVSPHETISADLGGGRVMIVYGRPYSKAPKTGETRKIWGGLVPFNEVWRTGADEATLLITEAPLVIGDTTVPAGAYSLYTMPKEDGKSQLIINKQVGQWGTDYDEKQDLARIDFKTEMLDAPVDQFTITITKGEKGSGTLKMAWEKGAGSVPLMIKK